VSQDLSVNLQQSILNASLAGNIDANVSLFSDDAVVMPPNDTTLFGKAEIQAWWEDYFQYFRIVSSAESENELTVADDQLLNEAQLPSLSFLKNRVRDP